MTTTLTVIVLILRSKVSDKTISGDAMCKEKGTLQKQTFGFKQFVNAQHECNENFNEGDLVLLGGKFTLDGVKMMVSHKLFLYFCFFSLIKYLTFYIFFIINSLL